ncbi:MAG: copper resistance CopC family protein [Pseudomonadota bacterium]
MKAKQKLHPVVGVTLAALLLALAIPLSAHQGKTGTTPADGATVQGSPAEIGIELDGAMRITQFEVTGPDGSVSLANDSGSGLAERYFVEPEETLPAGDYQVRWRGLSGDGHMVSGGFDFTVED